MGKVLNNCGKRKMGRSCSGMLRGFLGGIETFNGWRS